MKHLILFILLSTWGYSSLAQLSNTQAQQVFNVSEVANGGGENGKTGWSVVSGAATITNPTHAVKSKQFGSKYLNFNFAGSGSTIQTTLQLPSILSGSECTLSFDYNRAALNGSITYSVLSASLGLLTSGQMDPTTNWQTVTRSFPCSLTASLFFRITNSSGFVIDIELDNFNISKYKNTQSRFYYEGYIRASSGNVDYNMPTSGFQPALSTNNATLVNNIGTAQIACISGASSGTTCGAVNETAGITVVIPRPGNYRVCTTFSIQQDNADEIHKFRISRTDSLDQSNVVIIGGNASRVESGDASSTGHIINLCQSFASLVAGNNSFKLEQVRVGGAGSDFLLEVSDLTNMWSIEEL